MVHSGGIENLMTDSWRDRPLTVTILMEIRQSLRTWESLGTLDRETKYFRALAEKGLRINLISYGGRDEHDFASYLPGIRLLCNSMGLPLKTYQRRAHQVHALPLLRSDILRTYNMHSILAAMRAQLAWRIPLVFRFGYFWSTSAEAAPDIPRSLVQEAREYEIQLLNAATHLLPANQDLARGIAERVPSACAKTTVIPFYVDCDLFRPMQTKNLYDLVYVGRISRAHKNLPATLEAVERTGASIAIIGGGTTDTFGRNIEAEFEAELKARFGENNERIHWLGKVPNELLPTYLNQARALILCSIEEGHGRVVPEALSCGIPVIGSNIGGIAATLRHAETGYLCGTDSDSIAAAIKTVLDQPGLIANMGANARRYAVENLSLAQIAQREYELLVNIARRHPVGNRPARLMRYLFRSR